MYITILYNYYMYIYTIYIKRAWQVHRTLAFAESLLAQVLLQMDFLNVPQSPYFK